MFTEIFQPNSRHQMFWCQQSANIHRHFWFVTMPFTKTWLSTCLRIYSFKNLFFCIVIAMCAFVFCILRSVSFYTFALFTTKALHERMLSSVTQTRIRFFDLNPIGRILNRFSKDVGNIDDVLPLTLYDLFQVSGWLVCIYFPIINLNILNSIPSIPC